MSYIRRKLSKWLWRMSTKGLHVALLIGGGEIV